MHLRQLARLVLPRPARNWIVSPRKSARWAAARLAARAGRSERVSLRPGWSFTAHPGATAFGYGQQIHDLDQEAELDAFIDDCTDGMVLFDIGAHFGVFGLAAIHHATGSRVIAVDPSPLAVFMLRDLARRNGYVDRLTVVHAAASSTSGVTPLLALGIIAAGYMRVPSSADDLHDASLCEAVTIDSIVDRFGLPTHLKIDVEGFEADVLAGAARTLAAPDAPILYLEIHNDLLRHRSVAPSSILHTLHESGYLHVRRVDAGPEGRVDLLSGSISRIRASKPTATS